MNFLDNFLEIPVRLYIKKEVDKFEEESNEEIREGDEWKATVKDEPIPPRKLVGIAGILPENIVSYNETFSLQAVINNSKKPQLDTVELTMSNGDSHFYADTLPKLKALCEAWSNENCLPENP